MQNIKFYKIKKILRPSKSCNWTSEETTSFEVTFCSYFANV